MDMSVWAMRTWVPGTKGPLDDGVWHRDSQDWGKFIGGVNKIQILIREQLEDILRFFLDCSKLFFCLFLGGRNAPNPRWRICKKRKELRKN